MRKFLLFLLFSTAIILPSCDKDNDDKKISSIHIKRIEVREFNPTTNVDPWDEGESKTSSADLYIKFGNYESNEIYYNGIDSRYMNSHYLGDYNFIVDQTVTDIDSPLFIDFYDYDSSDGDDFMGKITVYYFINSTETKTHGRLSIETGAGKIHIHYQNIFEE